MISYAGAAAVGAVVGVLVTVAAAIAVSSYGTRVLERAAERPLRIVRPS